MNNSLREHWVRKAVTVDKLEVSKFQKEGSITAHMRQIIEKKSWYQAKQSANSGTNSLYDNDDFGAEYKDKESISIENRVGFILVPDTESLDSVKRRLAMIIPRNAALKNAMKEENVTEVQDISTDKLLAIAAEFETKVEKLPTADHLTDPCVYKVMANDPKLILTSSQKYSISIGQKSLDDIANSHIIRYPKEHELAGNVLTDKLGKVQYKATFFSEWHVEDKDFRTEDPSDYYLSKELKLELGEGAATVIDEQYMDAEVSDSQGQNA